MRKQYFVYFFVVAAIVLTAYGGYSLIYNPIHNKSVPVLGIVFFVLGIVMLLTFFVLLIISAFQNKKRRKEKKIEEPKVEEQKPEPQVEVKKENKPAPTVVKTTRNDVEYEPGRDTRSYSSETIYVRKIGYGPVLRIESNRILDMRNNTYYSLDGNMVKQDGYGPIYEISSNRIRIAFGQYLYEISGGNVNKVFGGYYASFSGGTLQTFDLKERYEIDGHLNLKQQLAVVALLFGKY